MADASGAGGTPVDTVYGGQQLRAPQKIAFEMLVEPVDDEFDMQQLQMGLKTTALLPEL